MARNQYPFQTVATFAIIRGVNAILARRRQSRPPYMGNSLLRYGFMLDNIKCLDTVVWLLGILAVRGRTPFAQARGRGPDLILTDDVAGGTMGGLTPKQCQVLDLLIQHKTSKEISRLLGISPHTVDQRILLARAKLNVATRNETAQAYRQLLAERQKTSDPDIYQRSIYGSSDMAETEQWAQVLDREATDGHVRIGLPAQPEWQEPPPRLRADLLPGGTVQAYHHVLPEAFDGRGGTLLRLGAVVVIAVLMTLLILGGMAIYVELFHMLDS